MVALEAERQYAPFWRTPDKLFPGEFHEFVKDWLEYHKPHYYINKGSYAESVFAEPPFQSNVLVLYIDC